MRQKMQLTRVDLQLSHEEHQLICAVLGRVEDAFRDGEFELSDDELEAVAEMLYPPQ